MSSPVSDDYVGSATIMDLPPENFEMICLRLSNPSDRFSLRATSRQLLPTVDGSWRDLQSLRIVFADRPPTQPIMASSEDGMATACSGGRSESEVSSESGGSSLVTAPDDPQVTSVQGTMTDPDTGEQRKFRSSIRSSKLMEFLKWIGPRLPSLELRTNDGYVEDDSPPISAADGHPIGVVLSACSNTTVLPSVVDVYVESRRLLSDRSLLDGLISWADCRRRAADKGETPFWRSLTLEPGEAALNPESAVVASVQLKEDKAKRAAPGWQPPADHRDIGLEVMYDVAHPIASSASRRWRRLLKVRLSNQLREWGSRDPDGDYKRVFSHLQMLMGSCESLQTLDIDLMLRFLEVRPTVLHYPKTLTELRCNRLGRVPGEIAVIVQNCPLLEEIEVNYLYIDIKRSIDNREDVVALTKLDRLKVLRLEWFDKSPEFTLPAFGVDSPHLLHQIRPESSPWPMLEEIYVGPSCSPPHLLITALINGCPKLSRLRFHLRAGNFDERAAVGTMLDVLYRLPRLTVLHCDSNDNVFLFGERHFESLAAFCPNLQELGIGPRAINLTWPPLLLRECPELREVYRFGQRFRPTAPDVSALLAAVAADVGDRNRRVVIGGYYFDRVSREALQQIAVGFPPHVRLCHSNFDDECLHGRRCCWRCCFKDGRSQCHSLVIGDSRRLHATVVFTYYLD